MILYVLMELGWASGQRLTKFIFSSHFLTRGGEDETALQLYPHIDCLSLRFGM
jgi:hypothetical protein